MRYNGDLIWVECHGRATNSSKWLALGTICSAKQWESFVALENVGRIIAWHWKWFKLGTLKTFKKM